MANVEFSQEIADRLCEELKTGRTLRDVCRDQGMPSQPAVMLWVNEDRGPGFADQYLRAREIGYHAMAEEVLAIADDGSNDWIERQGRNGAVDTVLDHEHVQRSKLRFDARRWLLSKALPKVYGDKLQHVGGSADDAPIAHSIEVTFVEAKKGPGGG